MVYIFVALILLAAFPLVLTIWRMWWAAKIKRYGVYTDSVITKIFTLRTRPGATVDILTLEYKDRATGQTYKGKATVAHLKYKIGDIMPVVYLPDRPAKYAVAIKTAHWAILVFTIILFLFVLFAVYKINEMANPGGAI
jgi:hypothetical protein